MSSLGGDNCISLFLIRKILTQTFIHAGKYQWKLFIKEDLSKNTNKSITLETAECALFDQPQNLELFTCILSVLSSHCSTTFAAFGSWSKILNLKCCAVWNSSCHTIAVVTVNNNVMDADQVSVTAFVSFPHPSLRILDNLTGRNKVSERLPLDF